jgi:hypothetical protein
VCGAPEIPSAAVRASRRRLSGSGGGGGLRFALRLLAGFVLALGLVQFVGIEDLETLEYLRSLDRNELTDSAMIQAGQGYQLGRPSPLMPPVRLDDVPRAA